MDGSGLSADFTFAWAVDPSDLSVDELTGAYRQMEWKQGKAIHIQSVSYRIVGNIRGVIFSCISWVNKYRQYLP